MMFRFVFFIPVLLLVINPPARAESWRGIIPLKSTRADVERILGPLPSESRFYDLPDHTVHVQYSTCKCGDKCKEDDWNIPPDTVVFIYVGVKGLVKLVNLNVDLRTFKKEPAAEDMREHFNYVNQQRGLLIAAGREYVSALGYGPTTKDKKLRCPTGRNKAADPATTGCKPLRL